MTKHYILSINPHAQYDWEQCSLRDPITSIQPDFADLIAQAVGDETGSYLVAVNIEVKVLEKELDLPAQIPLEVTAVVVNATSEMVA